MPLGREITNTDDRYCIPGYTCDDHFDDYPLMWNDFKRAGYKTLFIEEHPLLGIFNYELKGWKHPPFDHFPMLVSNMNVI